MMTRSLEVLGVAVYVPDPDDVASLAASFGAVRDNIAEAEDQLKALRSPQDLAGWTGQAATSFSHSIGRVPDQLSQARQSYSAVTQALADYAAQLRPLVAALSSLAARANEAEDTVRATTAAREQAIQQGQVPSFTGWDLRLQAAQTALNELRAQLSAYLAELENLSEQCAARIGRARPQGIHQGLFTELTDGLEDLGRGAAKVLDGGAKIGARILDDLLAPLTGFGQDVSEMLKDPSLENISKVLGDTATAVGLIALVVAAVLPGTDAIAAPILIGLTVASSGTEIAAAARHEKGASYGHAVLTLGLLGVGAVARGGISAGERLLNQAVEAEDSRLAVKLIEGEDARVSGGALWKAGLRHPFSWSEIKAGAAETIREAKDLPEALHAAPGKLGTDLLKPFRWGGDGTTHSPAVVRLQHVKFTTDTASHAVDAYYQDHAQKDAHK